MKVKINYLLILLCLFLIVPIIAAGNVNNPLLKATDEDIPKLENPITVSYLKKNLSKKSPKLILTPQIEKILKQKLKTDPLVQSYYEYLEDEAAQILTKPLLTRKLIGKRLLGTSTKMVNRMGILSMVYLIEKDTEILERIDAELNAVCNFSDWHPVHFLDVAEMSFAVALAIDCVGDALPKETVILAKSALIKKGILPSYVKNKNGKEMSWISTNNNWNQVCHGGMVAASLVIADKNPELAAKTISRALNKLTIPLEEYGPDGIYPEGPGYWGYGTMYMLFTSAMLTNAFGTDFGITDYPAFMKSADFILLSIAPSGNFFNFGDCQLKWNAISVALAWFAAKTGDGLYLDKTFFKSPAQVGRFAGPGLVWLAQFREKKISVLPLEWYGEGPSPLVFFRVGRNDPGQFHFAAKGGSASVNHSNMDAGTFIFELNGVRWVVDPGIQDYNELEQAGFNLWGTCQECQRWTLLTKGNHGHSTITVDNARHNVKGYAPITEFKAGKKPEVTIDLTEIFTGNLKSVQRKFIKESNRSLLIEDRFEVEDSTKNITWAIMTTANVIPNKGGAMLKQDGKELKLSILSPKDVQVSVISLDPPPLKLDKKIENLKRIEIRIPAWTFKSGKGVIKVRLSEY